MLDRFQLSGRFTYYQVCSTIPKRVIVECLRVAQAYKVGNSKQEIRLTHQQNGHTFAISYTVFKTEDAPGFLTHGPETDIIYCCAIIVEYEDFIIIYKEKARNFMDVLEEYVQKLDVTTLNGAFLDKKSVFGKATGRSIDKRKSSLRTVSYEGEDLRESMPKVGQSNRLLSSFKHTTKGDQFSISASRSHISVANSKGTFGIYVAWIIRTIEELRKKKKGHDFLKNFAEPLEFRKYATKIIPLKLMWSVAELLEYVTKVNDQIPRLFYKTTKGLKRYLPHDLEYYLRKLENPCTIQTMSVSQSKKYMIENLLDVTMQITTVTGNYKVTAEKLKHIQVDYDGTRSEGLLSLINRKSFFNLTFNQTEIHYAEGKLYRDSKLLGNINSFLNVFLPDVRLENITSEKGLPRDTAKKFPAKTLFAHVEAHLKTGLDHLILDDMSYEYADYIGVENLRTIKLFHCKAGDQKFSATAFQEVVAQAIKNLFFFTSSEMHPSRLTKWQRNYQKTKISRVRSKDKRNYAKDLISSLHAANCSYEVHLVVNFISKKTLSANLKALRKNQAHSQAAAPMLWLISSLVNMCAERNVRVFVHCKP
jgi:hypothetical protein